MQITQYSFLKENRPVLPIIQHILIQQGCFYEQIDKKCKLLQLQHGCVLLRTFRGIYDHFDRHVQHPLKKQQLSSKNLSQNQQFTIL